MGRSNQANLKKTIYFLKRNGLRRTWYAVRERMEERKQPPYLWRPPTEEQLAAQRAWWEARREREGEPVAFSILVPVYRTKPEYLRDLLQSLCLQTYPKWEVILADATEDDSVERIVQSFLSGGAGMEASAGGASSPGTGDARIRYVHLERNGGIAENTNQALALATGDYVGLLDHDDILAEDALYEMAVAIEAGERRGTRPQMLYSDEDKCNGGRTEYFEPNFKEDFNLDLLLSNNYICHFLVMRRELIQDLRFRPEYEGAQDYDLVLRAVARLEDPEREVHHIPKVLYHWRCHTGSTAENPESKRYAYEAGRRALQDFSDRAGWGARAHDTEHVGFYRLRFGGGLFDSRQDVGAVGGRLVRKGKICGGRMKEDGTVVYMGLPACYSGYLHRAVLSQDAEAVDLRNLMVRPQCLELFTQIVGVPYRAIPGTDIFDVSVLPEGSDVCRLSLKLCEALRREGYRILYLPDLGGEG